MEIQLEFHIDLDRESVSFEARLGSLLVQFSEPLGGLGGSLGRRRESEESAKRGLGAKVAPNRLWDLIWGALGRLLGRFLGGLGRFLGRQVGAKGVQQGSQRRS